MSENKADDIFGDDLLSPLTEQQPLPGSMDVSVNNSLSVTPDVQSPISMSESKSMENILLESSAMEESIDLGSQNTLAQSCATIASALSEENLGPVEGTTPQAECEESKNVVEFGIGAESTITADNTEGDSEAKKYFEETSQAVGDVKEVKDYFNIESGDTDDVFSVISQPKDETEKSTGDQDKEYQQQEGKSNLDVKNHSSRHSHVSVSKEEEVEFEEVKGEGLRPTMSTRSLTKFFTSDTDVGGSDVEGKSFFDTFTASETQDDQPSSPKIASPGLDALVPPPGGETPSPAVNLSTSPGFPSIPSPLHQQSLPPGYSAQVSSDSIKSNPSERNESLALEERLSSLDLYSTPTPPVQSQEEDPFTHSLTASDRERREDAWIPSESTRQTLRSILTSPPGIYVTPPEQRCRPCLISNDPQGDPVRDLVLRFMGEQEMTHRNVLSADDVSQDESGLHSLTAAECWRSAVDLTGRLLTDCGQGVGSNDQQCQHTPFSLKLWLVRVALLTKLHMYSLAENECQAFGSMDTADLYFEFYQDVYPGRRGSMVPFELRVLYAELPQYLGKSQETLDRLHYLLAIVNKILSNLRNGLAEDGSVLQLGDDSCQASIELWNSRKSKLLHSIGNCALGIKDYKTAVDTFSSALDLSGPGKLELLCGIGRIYLQMGDPFAARHYFDLVEQESDMTDKDTRCRVLMNRGFLEMEQNKFEAARGHFEEVAELQPNNAVAVNNVAVCWLYLGRLKDALRCLETLVHQGPSQNLHDGLLFNLCTLYELESSRAMHKKQTLLDLVNKNKGDGFNVSCLKMT